MIKTNPSSLKSRLPLSKKRVLRCAIRLGDKDGIDELSVLKLAQALGVKAMSLYNHVNNKDDIIDGMVAAYFPDRSNCDRFQSILA